MRRGLLASSALLFAALLPAACAGGAREVSHGGSADQYVPPSGTAFEFVPDGAMEALYAQDTGATVDDSGLDTLRVQVGDTAWDFAEGEGRHDALDWRLTDQGLFVGASQLLPPRTAEGESGAGVVVESNGPYTVWYGTFAEASTVQIDGGELSGEGTLAMGLGPIRLSYAGKVWELVYYERPTAE